MKLTYWISICTDDYPFSMRAKTAAAAKQLRALVAGSKTYEPVRKVTVEYKDAFDLLNKCLAPERGHWE